MAEVPVVLALMSIDPTRRTEALDYVFDRPVLIVVAIFASVALLIVVGWVAHRLGLGD
jgi:hypothetical protein